MTLPLLLGILVVSRLAYFEGKGKYQFLGFCSLPFSDEFRRDTRLAR